MLGARVHFLLQMAHIGNEVWAFGMSLGVAGAGHTEIAPAADEGHQLVGVSKVGLGREVGVAVAPESQHILHAVLLETGQQLGDLSLGAGHTGNVSHGGDMVLVLDDGGDLTGGLVHRAGAACAVGDADEVGLDILQAVQGLINAVHGAGLLGREHLTGEYGFAFSEQFCNFHRICLLSKLVFYGFARQGGKRVFLSERSERNQRIAGGLLR